MKQLTVLWLIIAYSAKGSSHFLRGEFLVAYNGVGSRLCLIKTLPLQHIVKHGGIFGIRENILRQERNKLMQRHGFVRRVF